MGTKSASPRATYFEAGAAVGHQPCWEPAEPIFRNMGLQGSPFCLRSEGIPRSLLGYNSALSVKLWEKEGKRLLNDSQLFIEHYLKVLFIFSCVLKKPLGSKEIGCPELDLVFFSLLKQNFVEKVI